MPTYSCQQAQVTGANWPCSQNGSRSSMLRDKVTGEIKISAEERKDSKCYKDQRMFLSSTKTQRQFRSDTLNPLAAIQNWSGSWAEWPTRSARVEIYELKTLIEKLHKSSRVIASGVNTAWYVAKKHRDRNFNLYSMARIYALAANFFERKKKVLHICSALLSVANTRAWGTNIET